MDLSDDQSICYSQFSNSISDTLQNLYDKKHFSDVTLISEDQKKVEAHKFILASCSNLFARILGNFTQPNSVIFLRGLKSGDMECLLRYCYFGEVKVSNYNVGKIMALIKEFEIWNDDSTEFISQEHEVMDNEALINEIVVKEENVRYEENMMGNKDIGHDNEKGTLVKLNIGIKSECSDSNIKKKQKAIEERSLKCNFCSYIAKRFSNLKSHEKRMHMGIKESVPSPCDDCGKVLRSKIALLTHKRSLHDNIPYRCNFENCTYTVKTRVSLNSHTQKVHKGIEYLCESCPKKFPKKTLMKKHYSLHHTDIPYMLCSKCEYKTKDKDRLRKHEAGHEGMRVSCDKCDYKTVWKNNLNDHLKKVHKQPVHKCDSCPFDSVNEQAVRRHVTYTHFNAT